MCIFFFNVVHELLGSKLAKYNTSNKLPTFSIHKIGVISHPYTANSLAWIHQETVHCMSLQQDKNALVAKHYDAK